MGFVKNYHGLMAVRWFLGLTEAGLFPGVGYFLSCWYKRSEFGVRMAIFFSAAALAGSFGGLLAAAIAKMDGIGNMRGWAWIFILEGLLTFIIGIASFWCVYDFPDQARFLSDIDRKRVLRRLAMDQQSSAEHEEFKMEYFWSSLKDWKTYTGAVIYMGACGSLYAFSLFVPTIISELVSCAHYLIGDCEANIVILRVNNDLGCSVYRGGLLTGCFYRLQLDSCSVAECTTICRCRRLDGGGWLYCRPYKTAWSMQYRRLIPRYGRIRYATRL